jgi:hypothetical protein
MSEAEKRAQESNPVPTSGRALWTPLSGPVWVRMNTLRHCLWALSSPPGHFQPQNPLLSNCINLGKLSGFNYASYPHSLSWGMLDTGKWPQALPWDWKELLREFVLPSEPSRFLGESWGQVPQCFPWVALYIYVWWCRGIKKNKRGTWLWGRGELSGKKGS